MKQVDSECSVEASSDGELLDELSRLGWTERKGLSTFRDPEPLALPWWSPVGSLALVEGETVVASDGARIQIRDASFRAIVSRRWFIHTLRVSAGGRTIVARSFSGALLNLFAVACVRRRMLFLRAEQLRRLLSVAVDNVSEAFTAFFRCDEYLRLDDVRKWRSVTLSQIAPLFKDARPYAALDERIGRDNARIAQSLSIDVLAAEQRRHNREWSAREGVRYLEIFGARPELGESALTPNQVQIATSNERNVLGLAAAGTGKTSVVMRKVEYHVRKGHVSSRNCLLLSFSNAAVDELAKRFKLVETLRDCQISTMHKFATDGMASLLDVRRGISELAKNEDSFAKWIGDQLTEMLGDPTFADELRDYLIAGMYPYRTHLEFATLGDYYDYLRGSRLLGLDDAWYKSFGEVFCANFALMNSLKYEYEKVYPHVAPSIDRAAYKPDFYFPRLPAGRGTGWFEFFGVDENDLTRPDIDGDRYRQDMSWKRNVHERFRTPLLFATYGEFRTHGEVPTLTRKFRDEWGATLAPLPVEDIAALLAKHGVRDRLAGQIGAIVRGARARNLTEAHLTARATTLGDRGRQFMAIYRFVLDRFERNLHQKWEADFDGMLRDLGDAIRGGLEIPTLRGRRYDLIFVDEFQDVTQVQIDFVRALADRFDARVVVVGDDCQNVFAFAGASRDAMATFEQQFGDTDAITFDRAFRCVGPILRVALWFVEKNPHQIRKNVQPHRDVNGETDARVLVASDADLGTRIDKALDYAISAFRRRHNRAPTVMVLARKSDNLSGETRQAELRSEFRCKINFGTVHGSKGLGADVVVVTDLVGGTFGFPDRRPEDPLITTLLESAQRTSDEDERRLLYVALTRAREYVVLCTDWENRSDFVDELLEHPEVHALEDLPRGARHLCPVCTTGVLRKATSKWRCGHRDHCDGALHACDRPNCGAPLFPDAAGQIVCGACGHRPPRCRGCRIGFQLIRRDGLSGCTRYSGDSEVAGRCTYRATIRLR